MFGFKGRAFLIAAVLSGLLAGCTFGPSKSVSPDAAPVLASENKASEKGSVPPRVYTANEVSNSVSVIDPMTNQLLMNISLGDEEHHRPLYNGFIDVHGLLHAPNGQFLLATARASSSVVKIDTATNKVIGYVSTGREPHAIAFSPNSREAWVTIRGENFISVIDTETMKIKANVPTVDGPGMAWFSKNGKQAFVTSQKSDQLAVMDTATYQTVKTLKVPGKFSPFIMVTPDGGEAWVVHKDTGKISIIDTKKLAIRTTFTVGPKPNHVTFVSNQNGDFAYVSISGTNQVEVYKRGLLPRITSKINVGISPHGIWPNLEMTRIYVDNEKSNDVYVIDTKKNKVLTTIPVGKNPIDLVYKP